MNVQINGIKNIFNTLLIQPDISVGQLSNITSDIITTESNKVSCPFCKKDITSFYKKDT